MKTKPNLESGHMGQDEADWPKWVNALIWCFIIGAALLAARCTGEVHAQIAMTNAPAANVGPARPKIEDLGVMTEHTLITLQKCQRRTDFSFFKVEVFPRNRRGWTNKVTFTTTNEVLKLSDFAAAPDGPALFGVRQYCEDMTPSPVALYRIDIQRDAPDAPKAAKSHILHMPAEQKIEHVIDGMENQPGPEPPMPPGMMRPKSAVPTRTFSHPLPGGIGETYSQYQAKLERRARAGERLKNER